MNLSVSTCALGSLGFSKDLSQEFYGRKNETERQRIIFRANDPTPATYNILDDLDLLVSGCYARGICCRSRRSP